MSRGKAAPLGKQTVNRNGYTMVKTSTGWRFKHHIEAEVKLDRPLADNERVIFIDGDKTNFDHDNLQVNVKQVRVNQTYDKRLTSIGDKMALFVEEAPDVHQALQDLRDALNDVRLSHDFGSI